MKKALSLLLALVLCLSLCACGNSAESKYIGTYSNSNYGVNQIVVDNTGYAHGRHTLYGTRTLTLNSDGTGKDIFIADEVPHIGTNITVYDCSITWEVIDEYLYITGTTEHYATHSGSTISVDDRYILEGKTLVDADYPEYPGLQLTRE